MNTKEILKNYNYLRIAGAEQFKVIDQVAEQLPPELREILDLAYIRQLPPFNICNKLRISERTMYRRKREVVKKFELVLNNGRNMAERWQGK